MAYKDLGLNAWPDVGDANTTATEDWLENSETVGDYLEAGIPTNGLLLDANLTLGTYGLTDVAYINFEPWTPTGTYNLGFNSSGELVARDGAGNSVILTSGGAINVGSVGGITGDFGDGAETFEYDDTAKKYIAYDSDTNKAKFDCELVIHEELQRISCGIGGAGSSTAGNLLPDPGTGYYRIQHAGNIGNSYWGMPVDLDIGSRVKQVDLVYRTAGSAATVTAYLMEDGVSKGSAAGSESATEANLSITSLSHTVVASKKLYVYLAVTATTLITELEIHEVTITYDRIA